MNDILASNRGRVKLAPEQDWSLCRKVQMSDGALSGIKDHAKVGVRALIANPYFALFDEMGAMKTAQTIIAAQFLYLQGVIENVIVICPASVKMVWYDPELGELAAQRFGKVHFRVAEFHTKIRAWDTCGGRRDYLHWLITNYEFLGRRVNFNRRKPVGHLRTLIECCKEKTLLVLDESSSIKSAGAAQSKACAAVRKHCGRVVLLNGTPIANNPIDLLNQGNIMSPDILNMRYVTQFRNKYCEMRPYVPFPQVMGWKNLEDLQTRFAPYVLRRLKEDCLDLPSKLRPVMIPVPLTTKTWKKYQEMRDELVVWFSENHASIASIGITKVMRLSQLTSGFISGVSEVFGGEQPDIPEFMRGEDWAKGSFEDKPLQTTQEIGTEKQDAVILFLKKHLARDPEFKLLIWCRFQKEVYRVAEAIENMFPTVTVSTMTGGQKKADRERALRLLHPAKITSNPAVLCATMGTGSMGHNFTGASVAVNMSCDYSLFKYKQGSDRIHRPGQTRPVSYFDMVATGPKGERTIDHVILKARQDKDDIATWTADAWVHYLTEE